MNHRIHRLKTSAAIRPGGRLSTAKTAHVLGLAQGWFFGQDDIPSEADFETITGMREPRERQHPIKQVGHWLFIKGGMAPILVIGIMLSSLVAALFGI